MSNERHPLKGRWRSARYSFLSRGTAFIRSSLALEGQTSSEAGKRLLSRPPIATIHSDQTERTTFWRAFAEQARHRPCSFWVDTVEKEILRGPLSNIYSRRASNEQDRFKNSFARIRLFQILIPQLRRPGRSPFTPDPDEICHLL